MTRRPTAAVLSLAGVLLAGPLLAACAGGSATPAAQGTTRTVPGSPAAGGPAAPTISPGSAAPGSTGQRLPAPVTSISTPASGSGIAGVTTINGNCPVARAEAPCPARAVTAELSIVDVGTNTVAATVTSGTNGYFSVPLKPGRYVLHPVTIGGGPPHPQMPAMVTVTAGHYTTITLRLNTGVQ